MPRGEVAYHLIATAAGYGIAWVTLKASEAESWFILPMTPAAQVRGRVVDAQGRPLAGVKVFVADLRPVEVDPSMSWLSFDEKTSPWWARTDRDGRFRIGGLPQDAQVGLRCASRLVRRDVTPFAVYASKSGDFGYVERAVEDEFTIILVPPAVIEGRVVSADTQQPAKGVNVWTADEALGGSATTDAQGKFVLRNLAPGSYALSASPPENSDYVNCIRRNIAVKEGERVTKV